MILTLLDTNIVLDALLPRSPRDVEAIAIFEANQRREVAAHLTATSLTDIFYIARRLKDRAKAFDAIRTCLDQLDILPVGIPELKAAMTGPGDDFEDNQGFMKVRGIKSSAVSVRLASELQLLELAQPLPFPVELKPAVGGRRQRNRVVRQEEN